MVLPMIVKEPTLFYIFYLNKFIVVGVYALKSANRILFIDMVGTFFAFKELIYTIRGPPNINLNLKKLNW